MKLKKLIIVLLLICSKWGSAQQICYYEHFSVEDGLPHNTINSIIQDQKGFIWLATTDGICRHDGYSFKTYKPNASDKILLKTNRVDKILSDSYGRIWMHAYYNKAYCFDPQTETFWGVEHIPFFREKEFKVTRIKETASGRVWLLSDKNGCVCIHNYDFEYTIYSKDNKTIDATAVNMMFEDKQQNSWLLTNNGLYLITNGQAGFPKSFFAKKESETNIFFSYVELDDEIWFGGNNGTIFKYSKGTNSFRTHKLPVQSNVIRLEKLNNQTILIVTDNDGFFTKDLINQVSQAFNNKTIEKLKIKNLIPISVTKGRYFWFVSNYERGMYQFDFITEALTYFPSSSTNVEATKANTKALVLEDIKGQTWVQPYGGGFSLFDEDLNSLVPFSIDPTSSARILSNLLHVIFFDNQGNLWYNAQSTGLVKVVFSKNNFNTLQLPKANQQSKIKDVRAIFQDSNNNFWVSTKENRIVILNEDFKLIGSISPEGKLNAEATWPMPAYTITQDHKGNIWIGTKGDGIYLLTPKLKNYEFDVQHYTHNNKDPYSLNCDNVYYIFQDSGKQIWIATFNGGLNKVRKDKDGQLDFVNFNNEWKHYPQESCNRVRCIAQNQYGIICAGTTGGLLAFDLKTDFSADSTFKLLEKSLTNEQSISSFDITDICIPNGKEMFIATAGGGLNKVEQTDPKGYPLLFKTYTRKDGLPSDYIVSFLDDRDGKIWISSENILTRFDPNNDFFETFTDVKWSLLENNFTEATHCRSSNGELLFGYTEGIMHFYPDQIKTNTFSPYLALTNFKLFNKETSINKGSVLPKVIDECAGMELSFNQNFFDIEFAALDFENTSNIQYAYKLEGFDNDWNYVQRKRIANYTNVPDGEYTFKVKSTNSEGVWINNERNLAMKIHPSFWKTPIAYIVYFLVFILIIFIIGIYVYTLNRLKLKVTLEKKESEMKQKFFTDISHEIRTPLTMISAPVENMLNDNKTPEHIKKQLSYIGQSSERMLRLVNQILDLRKILKSNLKISQINLVAFVSTIFNEFIELANEKAINFSFQHDTDEAIIWADRGNLEKIVMNLLSNAFKYTPNSKSITIQLVCSQKFTTLTVSDQGIGIAKDKQPTLFTRFVSFNTNASNPSTGIGLSLIKEMAEKHSAKVSVKSERGVGSSFSVQFLNGKEHFEDDIEFVASELPEKKTENEKIEDSNTIREKEKTIKTVLIVEDDPALLDFIKSILEPAHHVITASDGEMGYSLAINSHPDFIVSDIMMPKMNGIELLKALRDDIQTSHIPIILLTAKTNIESKLEGLKYGADDYITKPFSVAYFKARIDNLILQRNRLQQIYRKSQKTNITEFSPKALIITSADERIMAKIMDSIESNIDNDTFSVEDLVRIVGINRTTLNNKIKSLTGFTTVEFIRDVRLKRVAQLITESQMLIKEIAYACGFSDLKYFGKCFKNKYNMTPVEYRKQKN